MLDLEEINMEIAKLEKCDCTTYDICKKLAILYTVKDHYKREHDTKYNEMPGMSSPMMMSK